MVVKIILGIFCSKEDGIGISKSKWKRFVAQDSARYNSRYYESSVLL